MARPLKTAIVGYGYMGEIRRRVIENNPRLSLSGIYENNPEVRSRIKDCPVFESFEQLLREDVEVVFVCTPNSYSPQICIQSMEKGKHVFCEKPPGRDVEDIRNIVKAENNNVKLMFGFNHRFHPGVVKAKVIAENKRLGRIISMRGVYGKSGGLSFRNSWRNDKGISGGGILLDQGIHMLDLFLYFCGGFEKIKCFVDNSFWKFDVEDNAYVIMKNEKGQAAFLHSSSTLWKHTFDLIIILEDGYMVIDGLLSKTGSYGREKLVVGKRQFEDEAQALGNPMEEVTYFDRDSSWDIEVAEFVKCIDNNRPVTISSSQDALKVMELVEKAYLDAGQCGRFGK